jgi:hypothetical protein
MVYEVSAFKMFFAYQHAYVNSGFRRDVLVDEIGALQGYYAALSGSSVSTFRGNLSVPSSRVFLNFMALQGGTDKLPRNVGTELSLNAA